MLYLKGAAGSKRTKGGGPGPTDKNMIYSTLYRTSQISSWRSAEHKDKKKKRVEATAAVGMLLLGKKLDPRFSRLEPSRGATRYHASPFARGMGKKGTYISRIVTRRVKEDLWVPRLDCPSGIASGDSHPKIQRKGDKNSEKTYFDRDWDNTGHGSGGKRV